MERVLSLLSLENGCHNSHSQSKIREICKVTLCLGRGFTSKTLISPRKATYLWSDQTLLKQGRTRCQWYIYCSGWNNNSSEAAVKAQQWSLKPRMKRLSTLILMLLGVSDPIWSLKELPMWRMSMISRFEVVLHASVVGIGEGPCLEEGLCQWTHFCFIQTVNFQWQMPDSWPQVKDTHQWFTVFNKGTDYFDNSHSFLRQHRCLLIFVVVLIASSL